MDWIDEKCVRVGLYKWKLD